MSRKIVLKDAIVRFSYGTKPSQRAKKGLNSVYVVDIPKDSDIAKYFRKECESLMDIVDKGYKSQTKEASKRPTEPYAIKEDHVRINLPIINVYESKNNAVSLEEAKENGELLERFSNDKYQVYYYKKKFFTVQDGELSKVYEDSKQLSEPFIYYINTDGEKVSTYTDSEGNTKDIYPYTNDVVDIVVTPDDSINSTTMQPRIFFLLQEMEIKTYNQRAGASKSKFKKCLSGDDEASEATPVKENTEEKQSSKKTTAPKKEAEKSASSSEDDFLKFDE